MGFDPSGSIGTGCQRGMVAMRSYIFEHFGGGDLGCFNPASVAGGRPSLHAQGRAGDFAFDARDDEQRAAGDRLFRWAVAHADELGLQEMLWRGAVWFYPRRLTEDGWGDFADVPGVYGPVQQADHMSHVHLGVDLDAAINWTPDRLGDDAMPLSLADFAAIFDGTAEKIAGRNLDGSFTTNAQLIEVLFEIRDELRARPVTPPPAGGTVDLDALADVLVTKILDRAAARLTT